MNSEVFIEVFRDPWLLEWRSSLLLVSMGWLVAIACGWLGVMLLLRRIAMMGDTLSHSLLPGLVIAFLITGSRATWVMWIGALVAAGVTIVLIELIQRYSRIKADAAMGVVFSFMFALGVILITLFSRQIDLDADCVLYGELLYLMVEPGVHWMGVTLPPAAWLRMVVIAALVIVFILSLYKELLASAFDNDWAGSAGLPNRFTHHTLMAILSLTIVSAFEAVGAILVVAMLVFPGATALLHCRRLPLVLAATSFHSLVISLAGFHLSIWLNVSMAAAMATVAMLWMISIWSGQKIKSKKKDNLTCAT
ncbi:MAG: metal ABC transporter permease [Verrucomicrobia bacterium]|nr:metal ABC transporter permease [Verrucomicrobiota bacterium]